MRVAVVADSFPPHSERKRIGWNKTLLSTWSACSAALKRYCVLFSESEGETCEQIAVLVPNHLLIRIRKALGNANPSSSAGKPRWRPLFAGSIGLYQKHMLLVTHLKKPKILHVDRSKWKILLMIQWCGHCIKCFLIGGILAAIERNREKVILFLHIHLDLGRQFSQSYTFVI